MQQKYSDITLPSVVYSGTKTKSRDWEDMPSDWTDIRKICPENAIALYVAHKDDYSAYDNLGFTVTCTGGYNVFIDGAQYGTTYASNAQCSITWSTSGITTGEYITTPSALKAHKILIEPATEGNNITWFKCQRVASSGTEEQGLLWAHFNISNSINLETSFFGAGYSFMEPVLQAITAKNNILTASGYMIFRSCEALEYLPVLSLNGQIGYFTFTSTSKLTQLQLKDTTYTGDMSYMFYESGIEKIKLSNSSISITDGIKMFQGCEDIEELPDITFTNTTDLTDFITNATSLNDTVLDVSAATGLTKIGCYGDSSHFMSGFKGLRVSSSAPFSGTAPQINVSYTGMDRNALVQLFEDLPYNVGYEVVGSPTITDGVASGFTDNDYAYLSEGIPDIVTKYKLHTEFTTGDSFDGKAVIVGTYAELYGSWGFILNSDGKIFGNIFLANGDDTSQVLYYKFDTGVTVVDNQKYYAELYFSHDNKNIISKVSTDGINWTTKTVQVYDNAIAGSFEANRVIGFGKGQEGTFKGSIDIAKTYIEINDVKWFNGQPAMTKTLNCVGATGNKLVTVGSPTISNGVASGFVQGQNRIEVAQVSNTMLNDFEFVTRANCNNNSLPLFYCTNTLFWLLIASDGQVLFRTNDLSDDIRISLPDSFNTTSYFNYKLKIKNNVVSLYFAEDNAEWQLVFEQEIPTPTSFDNTLQIGNNALWFANDTVFTGLIDLNNTYIKVNEKYWYKTDINALLPEDKAIATDKGWSLTLS